MRLTIYGIVSAQLPIPHATPGSLLISLTANAFVSSPYLYLRALFFLATPYAGAKSRPRKALLTSYNNAGGSWATSETPHALIVTHYADESTIDNEKGEEVPFMSSGSSEGEGGENIPEGSVPFYHPSVASCNCTMTDCREPCLA